MNEKIKEMELRQKRTLYELKCQTQEMFNATPYIGPHCTFETYAEFIAGQISATHNAQERISGQFQMISAQERLIQDATRQTEESIKQL